MHKKISVIMPTYNSGKTIENSLRSVREQIDINQDEIEILVIDGGSTDETLNTARHYGAIIYNNEARMPEAAKEIGLKEAAGDWIIFLDSDEAFTNTSSISQRLEFLEECPEIKYLATAQILSPTDASGATKYMNRFGDPFSNFVYYFYNGNDRVISAKKRFSCEEYDNGIVVHFRENQVLPIYDAKGDMFDRRLALKLYADCADKSNFAGTVFDRIARETGEVGILYDDPIIHSPDMNSKSYRAKLLWRIKNNIYGTKTGVGYTARTEMNGTLKRRQYLFVPYAITFIGPIIRSLAVAVKEREAYYLTDFFWTEYVFFNICYYYLLKIFGIGVKSDDSYGK